MLALMVLIVASSLAVVASSFKSRQLFVQLQTLQKEASSLQVRRGQLLLEESTWASPALIEQQAVASLSMRVPSGRQLQIVDASTGVFHRSPAAMDSAAERSGGVGNSGVDSSRTSASEQLARGQR